MPIPPPAAMIQKIGADRTWLVLNRFGTNKRNVRIAKTKPASAGLPHTPGADKPGEQGTVRLVAIVGGSGSGKTCLAKRLQQSLGQNSIHLSLDDFYLDRSHLTPGRRARLNFDHPRAIDWPLFERVLRALRRGRGASVPEYDFATHSRRGAQRRVEPRPVVLADGLWLLRRPSVRRLFSLTVFLDCPATVRLSRRLARDVASRGRTRRSVIQQFRSTVEPMHRAYVEPQRRYAHIIIKPESLLEKTSMLLKLLAQ